ncbi:phytoene dehydrogenase-like oxidoreductase [Candidatus Methanoperedens nitroreducens]|uniref:Phytoene dehydrogenase-like oxidoreductase n=1 Tax=Candidatus Methanoperedens nitratireducens TaxID=1392998 RepID=A0A062V879_9EURY|nr:NAD(P)/FAD-dependent oxidoreductase [Candidatus Methanoperedens nitroreducens]KCZ71949.1 phytoene dehydrogenase-like oxidoreductase [Candidatus Methanoperedens nitroreducens]MDJ1422074.1 NAD(P)/FAD-dependent oxidoreductase [Candidatus Methanoperedens sp.]
MRAIILGAGLGGLLCGAKLSKAGYDVEIFERLPIIGGRFANLEYRGFKLSTGALHMIPHGSRGPLARMLREVGASVTIIDSNPMAVIRMDTGQDIEFRDFKKQLPLTKSVKLGTILAMSAKFKPKSDISFKEWTLKYFDDIFLLKLADSFCGWSLSMQAKDVPAREVLDIIDNMHRYSGSGVPLGGCSGVTGALLDVIRSNGGRVHTRSCVDRIITDKDLAVGISVNGRVIDADIVISNIGHPETSRMYECKDKQYLERIKKIKPSKGIKICLSSDEPLIGHCGVLFTPFTERINGLNEVTNADPSLAPQGKHLTMSHQAVISDDLNLEINLGLRDLKRLFPDKKYEVLLVQSYSNGWPVNRASSGSDIGNKTPIGNLYVVGDGAKGRGGIEVEGVALGVMNVMNEMGIR